MHVVLDVYTERMLEVSQENFRRRCDLEPSAAWHELALRLRSILQSQQSRLDALSLEMIMDLARRIATLAAANHDTDVANAANAIELFATAGIACRKVDDAHLAAKLDALCDRICVQVSPGVKH